MNVEPRGDLTYLQACSEFPGRIIPKGDLFYLLEDRDGRKGLLVIRHEPYAIRSVMEEGFNEEDVQNKLYYLLNSFGRLNDDSATVRTLREKRIPPDTITYKYKVFSVIFINLIIFISIGAAVLTFLISSSTILSVSILIIAMGLISVFWFGIGF